MKTLVHIPACACRLCVNERLEETQEVEPVQLSLPVIAKPAPVKLSLVSHEPSGVDPYNTASNLDFLFSMRLKHFPKRALRANK